MKLTLPWLRSQSVAIPAACVLIAGTKNLYTHPKLPGVLLRRLATAESALATNGVVFFVKTTSLAHYGYSSVVGEFFGYAGAMWRRVLHGEIDLGLSLQPKPASITPDGTIVVGKEIAGISNYTATGVKSYQVDGYEEQRVVPFVLAAAAGASGSYNLAAGLAHDQFSVMEIVSSADDGVLTSSAGTLGAASASAGPAAAASGYLATVVTLPPLHELIERNAATLIAEFPEDIQDLVAEMLPPFIAGWANPRPTLAFWLDPSDGLFGVPRYIPKDSTLGILASLMPPSDSRPMLMTGLIANGANSMYDGVQGRTYTISKWPGEVDTVAGVTAPYFHATAMTRSTVAISGMIDVIDVNMLRRGLSPHNTSIVQDLQTQNSLPTVLSAGRFVPRVSPNWLATITGTTEAITADVANQMSAQSALNYPATFEHDVALSVKRNGNVGTLMAHMYAFVEAFSDAVYNAARTRYA